MPRPRSPLFAALPAAAALGAAAARWSQQGAGNRYTELGRRFYRPDPDLGWRLTDDGPIFLGLDALAGLAALVIGLVLAGWLLGRRERARGEVLGRRRGGLWLASAAAWLLPIAALASGGRPTGAELTRPRGVALAPPEGIAAAARLDAPAGTWRIARHPGSRVSVSIAAGGDRFDGRFAGPTGFVRFDPRALDQPIAARVELAAATLDTGVGLRSQHAIEMLEATRFPTLALELTALDGARALETGLGFAARGRLELMGQAREVAVTGTLRLADAAARARLGLDRAVLVAADAALDLRDTPLVARADDFDDPRIDIHIDLVLTLALPTERTP